MSRCLSLFLAMLASVDELKQLMMDEEMEFLALFHVRMGRVGDEGYLEVLVALGRRHIALRTLKKLLDLSRNSVLTSVIGLINLQEILLMVAVGVVLRMRDAQNLISQLDVRVERKLPCNQNQDLIFSSVDPDLVNKSAGLRIPGHQNQLSALVSAEICMILVP